MLTCKDATRLVSEGLDRKLPLRSRISLRVHLMMCAACRLYRRQIVGLHGLLQHYFRDGVISDSSTMVSLSPESRQRIKESLKRASG